MVAMMHVKARNIMSGGESLGHRGPRSVYRTVTKDLTGGATILLHDCDCAAFPGSWKASLGALPALIHTMRRQHLTVGTLGEHHHHHHRNGPSPARVARPVPDRDGRGALVAPREAALPW